MKKYDDKCTDCHDDDYIDDDYNYDEDVEKYWEELEKSSANDKMRKHTKKVVNDDDFDDFE